MKHINGNHIKPFFVLLWEVSTTDDREDHKQFILMFYSYLFTTLNKLLLWDISLIFTLITCMVIRNWGFVFLVVVVFLFCFFIFLYILPWTALWITFNDFFLYIMRCRFHFHIRILKVLLRNIQCINLGETGMLNLHFILYVLKTCCFSINLNSHHSSPVSFVYCKVQKMFFKCSLYRPVFVLDNKWFFSCLLSLSFSVTEQMTTIIVRSELRVTDPSDYPRHPSESIQQPGNRKQTDSDLLINLFIYFSFIYLFIYFVYFIYLFIFYIFYL